MSQPKDFMNHLPPEIWDEILSQVDDKDLVAWRHLHQIFWRISARVRWRELTLGSTTTRDDSKLQTFLGTPNLSRFVERVRIVPWSKLDVKPYQPLEVTSKRTSRRPLHGRPKKTRLSTSASHSAADIQCISYGDAIERANLVLSRLTGVKTIKVDFLDVPFPTHYYTDPSPSVQSQHNLIWRAMNEAKWEDLQSLRLSIDFDQAKYMSSCVRNFRSITLARVRELHLELVVPTHVEFLYRDDYDALRDIIDFFRRLLRFLSFGLKQGPRWTPRFMPQVYATQPAVILPLLGQLPCLERFHYAKRHHTWSGEDARAYDAFVMLHARTLKEVVLDDVSFEEFNLLPAPHGQAPISVTAPKLETLSIAFALDSRYFMPINMMALTGALSSLSLESRNVAICIEDVVSLIYILGMVPAWEIFRNRSLRSFRFTVNFLSWEVFEFLARLFEQLDTIDIGYYELLSWASGYEKRSIDAFWDAYYTQKTFIALPGVRRFNLRNLGPLQNAERYPSSIEGDVEEKDYTDWQMINMFIEKGIFSKECKFGPADIWPEFGRA